MAYTLADPRLASALAPRGYLMTVGGKSGYTVGVIEAPAKPNTTCVAKARPGS
jgi:hypothetical protein